MSTHLSVLDSGAFSPTSQEIDLNQTQLRLVREQTSHCIRDLNALRAEVMLLKSEVESDRLSASAAASSMEGKQIEVQEHFERERRERDAVLQQLSRKVHDLDRELPPIRDEMSLVREQIRALETAWHPHIEDLQATFLKDVEARHQAHGQLEQRLFEIDAGMAKHSALHKDLQDRLQTTVHQEHVERLGREIQTHVAKVAEMQEHHANLRNHLESEKETKNKALEDLNSFMSQQLGRNLSAQSAPIQERLDYLEKLMGDSAARHARDLAAAHQKIQDHSFQSKGHVQEQMAYQTSLASRVEFLEKSLGDSAAKQGQELRDAHQKISDLHGLTEHSERKHSSLQERMDFIENLLGDNVQKHSVSDRCSMLSCGEELKKTQDRLSELRGKLGVGMPGSMREGEIQVTVESRLKYLEQALGDSDAKHREELSHAHGKLEALHGRLGHLEVKGATLDELKHHCEKQGTALEDLKCSHANLSSDKSALDLHHARLKERVDYLETMMGDSTDHHKKAIEEHKANHAKLANELRAREASHATLADRMGYIEQRMGDSFEKHAQLEREGRLNPSGSRRARDRDEDDEDEGTENRGTSGPPPSWDGTTAFEDFNIKARLWIATTKAKPRMRGPLILRSLSLTPFEVYKHWAKDSQWLQDPNNAEKLLDDMNRPERYGDDQQEHMLTAMSRVTYHLRRLKGEDWREFFSRWDTALRKVHQHAIQLPEEYEGFLLINGLLLTDSETKALLNFTHGCIKPSSIKCWLRKNETKLSAAELGADRDKKKVSQVLYTVDEDEHDGTISDSEQEMHDEIKELEAHIVDLQRDADDDDIISEADAAEILATFIQQKKKSYTESIKNKKTRELARGYGANPRSGFGSRNIGQGRDQRRQQSDESIAALKRRTRCARCGQIGHWKRECRNPPSRSDRSDSSRSNEANFLENTHEVFFVGSRSIDRTPMTEAAEISLVVSVCHPDRIEYPIVSMMECSGSNKRSRAEPNVPLAWSGWSRLARKLLQLLIPLNLMIERILGEHRDQSRVLRRAVRYMETEDLTDFQHFIQEEINRRGTTNIENPNSEIGSPVSESESDTYSLLTWKSTSPRSNAAKAIPKKTGKKEKIEEENTEKIVDDVQGLEMLIGPRPMCNCRPHLPTQVHVSHTPKNPDRMFFRCPKEQGTQCRFFQWCPTQPLQDVTSWKHRQQPGEEPKNDAEVLISLVQESCPHPKTHGRGSNQHVKKTTCCNCDKVISVVPRNQATSSKNTQEQEFAQFQEYLKWKNNKG
eukprot:s2194_g10.t1